MATIKSYSDLQQSKKLAEILSLESADMIYVHTIDLEGDEHYDIDFRDKNPLFEDDVCAWSLAALIGVLPNPSLHKVYTGWRCDTYNENCTQCQLGNTADTPVDACYEMILKLNELNLL